MSNANGPIYRIRSRITVTDPVERAQRLKQLYALFEKKSAGVDPGRQAHESTPATTNGSALEITQADLILTDPPCVAKKEVRL